MVVVRVEGIDGFGWTEFQFYKMKGLQTWMVLMVEYCKCTAGKTAQQVKVVMYKLGEWSLIPGTPIKMKEEN